AVPRDEQLLQAELGERQGQPEQAGADAGPEVRAAPRALGRGRGVGEGDHVWFSRPGRWDCTRAHAHVSISATQDRPLLPSPPTPQIPPAVSASGPKSTSLE